MNWLYAKELCNIDDETLHDEDEHALNTTLQYSAYANQSVQWLLENLDNAEQLSAYSNRGQGNKIHFEEHRRSKNLYDAYRTLIEDKTLTDEQWVNLLRFLHDPSDSLHPYVKKYANEKIQNYQERLKACIQASNGDRKDHLKTTRKQFNEHFDGYSNPWGKFWEYGLSEPGEGNQRWRADNVRELLEKKLSTTFVPEYLHRRLVASIDDPEEFIRFAHSSLLPLLEKWLWEDSTRGRDSIDNFLLYLENVSTRLGKADNVHKILKWLITRFGERKEYAKFIARIKRILLPQK